MASWCEYCEEYLDDCFLEKIKMNPHPELNWNRSSLKREEHSKIFLLLTELYYCDCCTKHQVNKPAVPTRWKETFPNGNMDITCSCDCRHLARMICRSYK